MGIEYQVYDYDGIGNSWYPYTRSISNFLEHVKQQGNNAENYFDIWSKSVNIELRHYSARIVDQWGTSAIIKFDNDELATLFFLKYS